MAETPYLAIARKWRPQTFDEVVGQEHIIRTLKNSISSGRIHHAFLFIGSRGIGKTTTARILAKALNCSSYRVPTITPCNTCDNCVSISAGNCIDVIEIDGASNNTVDDVRAIRENVRMSPASGRYKIYIIDEVHQLSSSAFNALLKTLEEPPSHAVFILATTEVHKIPATIISRCQRFDFRRVAIADIVGLLKKIVADEKITADEDALFAIARVAEGGVRDAQSILDELITYCDDSKTIRFQDVFDVLGLVNWQYFHNLCDAILEGNVARQLEIIEDIVSAGKDLSQFIEDIVRYFRNLLVCLTVGKSELLLRLPEAELNEMRKRAGKFTPLKLIRIVEQFSDLVRTFDSQIAQRTALEALLIRMSRVDVEISLDTVIEKLLLLGKTAGTIPPRNEPPPNPTEAGPLDPIAAAPADNSPSYTEASFIDTWRKVLRHMGQEASRMALMLGRCTAKPPDEQGILRLEFEPGAKNAYEYFLQEENRLTLQKFLSKEFSGISSISLSLKNHERKRAKTSKVSDDSGTEESNDMRVQCAKHPGIAIVLKEFRGEIVEIKRNKNLS